MRNFKLKKVKIHDDMSEETMCFSAQLWVDGKHVADVSNKGCGGSNDFYVHKPFTYKDIAEFDTLDGEVAIFEMADEIDTIKRNQSKKVILKKDGKLYTQKLPMPITRLRKHSDYPNWLTKLRAVNESRGYEILNTNL